MTDLVGEVTSRPIAVSWPLGQRLQANGLQRRRCGRAERPRRGRRFGGNLAKDVGSSIAVKGRPSGEYLVEDRTQAINVGAPVNIIPPALGLFGAHVSRSAQHLALNRLAAIGVRRQRDRRSECLLRAFNELRQPPVEHDDFTVVTQDHVLWLEIAMDHTAAMGVSNGVTHPEEGPEERSEFERVELALLARHRWKPWIASERVRPLTNRIV